MKYKEYLAVDDVNHRFKNTNRKLKRERKHCLKQLCLNAQPFSHSSGENGEELTSVCLVIGLSLRKRGLSIISHTWQTRGKITWMSQRMSVTLREVRDVPLTVHTAPFDFCLPACEYGYLTGQVDRLWCTSLKTPFLWRLVWLRDKIKYYSTTTANIWQLDNHLSITKSYVLLHWCSN